MPCYLLLLIIKYLFRFKFPSCNLIYDGFFVDG
nr:MAG TPA: hypothetical protein [Caudoviricetes sp.]